MVELELVGLSGDGTQLVLADAAGGEFAVPLDDRLRAAVRADRVRTGQLETSMETALRPRDIQARIRAGQTPEAVADVAQVSVDRIMGYAVPVMAERQHIAERAQRSAVRRKHADGPGQLLWDAVAERLRSRNVDPHTCQWDAWRREDGRWTVTACYRDEEGERTGTFVFDALSRYAVADDDDGRWLVGEPTAGGPDEPRRATSGRRLSPVATEYDAMLFDDEPTTDLTAVADVLGDGHERHDADAAEDRSRPSADAAPQRPPPRRRQREDEPDVDAAAVDQERGEQSPKPQKRPRRGRGRASVPSWDEIMFGQPKG